jgi:hypothetical protein
LQRLLTTGLLLGLLVATAAAFAITEGLKLVPSPIRGTVVQRTFSPTCHCAKQGAAIRFRLRRADTVTLDVLNADRRPERRLVGPRPAPRGENRFVWNGRTDAGTLAPNGVYLVRVHLAHQRRTILLPNRIELDTRPPSVLEANASRAVFSPDGDGQSDSVTIHYRFSEAAHALLFVGGTQVIRTKRHRADGSLTWYGTLQGKKLARGTYRLRVGAEDLAGNVTPTRRVRTVVVRIRYVALARRRLVVPTKVRFGVRVDSDATSFSWRLGAQHGVAAPGLLVLRSPAKPGRYRLVVTANGHSDRALVVVRPRA